MGNKNNNNLFSYRQPAYYRTFRCQGGSCPNSCCVGWKIDWTGKAVEKLRNSECSEELAKKAAEFFEKVENNYRIKLGENGRCPFLTEDNFCSIQRELGEEYLAPVCTDYPRLKFIFGEFMYRKCSMSCYPVLKTICTDEKAMELEYYQPKTPKSSERYQTYENFKQEEHPEFKFHSELLEFFYEIIADTTRSVETSIVIGALAAQKLTDYISKGQAERIPEIIEALKPQLNAPSVVESIEKTKSNPSVCLGVQARAFDAFYNMEFMVEHVKNGNFNFDSYNKGYAHFNEVFKPFALRNIALNMLLELNMPFKFPNEDLFRNYSYFTAAFSTVKLVAATAWYWSGIKGEDSFLVTLTKVDRKIGHSPENFNKIMKILEEYNCKSPAYLAVIVK